MAEHHIQITTHSVTETQHLGRTLGAIIQQPTIIALSGDLGSGKTALVQGLAKGLDVSDAYYITSPTFTLINEYPGRFALYHVDLYRIDNPIELQDVGLDEVLQADAVIAIEWAEKLAKDILPDYLHLQLDIIGESIRRASFFAYGHPAANLLKALESQLEDRIKNK